MTSRSTNFALFSCDNYEQGVLGSHSSVKLRKLMSYRPSCEDDTDAIYGIFTITQHTWAHTCINGSSKQVKNRRQRTAAVLDLGELQWQHISS